MMYLFQYLVLFSTFFQSDSTLIKGDGENSAVYAENYCKDLDMDLMMLSTKQEYDDAMDFLQIEGMYVDLILQIEGIEKALVGIKWNETLQSYQWNNGKRFAVVNWEKDEPPVQNGATCVVMDTYGKWRTALCTEANHYICSTSSVTDPTPSESADAVDFYTAYQRCVQLQQSLPVIITQTEQEYFNGVSRNNDVWLGIYSCGNVYKWLTGVELSPALSFKHGNLHLDEAHIEESTVIHIERKDFPFACQTRNSNHGSGTYKLSNYYSRVNNMAPVMDIYLKEFTYLKKTECAMECSKSQECYQYTRDDSVCRLYGNVCFTDDTSGVPLWKRKQQ